tara:strand:- start:525 stop:1913 length:1389 start_codon:yes stop_codon:yes gene_type:complete
MAKVTKINKTNTNKKKFSYWCVDARSIGLKIYYKNPNTNQKFETKKEAEIFLNELHNIEVKRHQSDDVNLPVIEPQKNDLLLSDICAIGDSKNDGAGIYLERRFEEVKRQNLSRSQFDGIRNSIRVFLLFSSHKSWLDINLKRDPQLILNQMLEHRILHAVKKETNDLTKASAWTTFLQDIKNIKAMSSWVANEYDCDDKFKKIITRTKNNQATYKKPAHLHLLQKEATRKSVDKNRIFLLRQWIEDNYFIHKGKFVHDEIVAKERRRNLLTQFDLIQNLGLRIGECLALTWDDVEVKSFQGKKVAYIRINKQLELRTGKIKATKGTKDTSLYGDVKLATAVLPESLETLKRLQPNNLKLNNIVFPNLEGKYDLRLVLNRQMKKGSKKLWNETSEHISPHTLRHAMATYFVKKHGKNRIGELSSLLRHESGQHFTESRYVSNLDKSDDQLYHEANLVEDLYI